jgi:beta-lactamase class A
LVTAPIEGTTPAAQDPAPIANPPAPALTTPSSPSPDPAAPTPPAAVVDPSPPVAAGGPTLDERINGVINAYGDYQVGVALIDMSDGQTYRYGARAKFVAASTAKILAAVAYYHLVESGSASLTAPLGAYVASFQIQQMVKYSNNESWALITAAIGYQRLREYAASIGITYDRTVNTLTPAEMAGLLNMLYSGQLINRDHTAQLLSFMQHTNYETLIPAAVPPGTAVFHKYGLLDGNLHDASILVKGDRGFVFVVYTLGRNMASIPARTRAIHDLTRIVVAGLG